MYGVNLYFRLHFLVENLIPSLQFGMMFGRKVVKLQIYLLAFKIVLFMEREIFILKKS